MATELAAAYVTLIPSLKGAQSTITSQLSGMDFSSAGSAMGKSLSKGFDLDGLAGSLTKAGGKLSGVFSAIAKPAVGAIGAIGGSLLALTAQGGISRALKIESAEHTFKGLKFTAEQTASAMESANTAVLGTAFGLDSAAQAAALLATSGVSLGDDMTRSLQAIAGTASMAGTTMEDITGIFQKVAAQGKVDGDTLISFASRGVNVTSALADSLGITQEEVKDLVKKGEIGFQTFSDAMYDAFGEAAYGANETFSGAMMNVRAALSRVGEKFADPALDGLRRVFVAAIPAINAVKDSLAPLVDRFSEMSTALSDRAVAGLETFTEALEASKTYFYDEFGNQTDRVKSYDWLGSFRAGIEAALGPEVAARIEQVASAFVTLAAAGAALQGAGAGLQAVSGFMESVSGMADAAKGGAAAAIGALSEKAASLKDAVTPSSEAVQGLFNSLKAASLQTDNRAGSMLDKIVAFGGQVPHIKSAFNELGTATSKALTPIKAIGSVGGKMLSGLGSAARVVGSGAIAAAGALGGMSVQLLGLGAAAAMGQVDLQEMADGVLSNMQALSEGVGPVAQQVASMLPGFVEQVSAALPGMVGAIGEALSTIAEVVPEILPQVIDALTSLVTQLAPMIVSMAPMLLQAGMQLFTGLVQALAQTAPQIIAQLPALISGLLSTLLANLPALIAASLQLFLGIMIGLTQAAPQIIAILIQFIPQLVQVLVSMAPMMLQGAVQLFRAIGQGLVQIAPLVGQALLDFVTHLPEIIMSAIGGMADAGAQLLGGLIDGLTGKAPQVDYTASAIGTSATWSLMGASDWTTVGGFATDTFVAGMNQPTVVTTAQNIGTNAVDNMRKCADAFGVGENISTTALAGLQASPFSDTAVQMTQSAVDAAMAVDATPVGQQFSEQAAAGVDTSAMNAVVQEMMSSVAAMETNVHIGLDVDTSGIGVLSAAASLAQATYANMAAGISSSMSQAASAASAAGSQIRSAIDIPDKTVYVNVAPGYVSLPHFNISGSFDLKSGSVPTVGVSWWENGGVFTQPSVIGVAEGREPEGVFPLSWLEDKIGGGDTYNITLDYKAGDDANKIVRDLGFALRTSAMMEG